MHSLGPGHCCRYSSARRWHGARRARRPAARTGTPSRSATMAQMSSGPICCRLLPDPRICVASRQTPDRAGRNSHVVPPADGVERIGLDRATRPGVDGVPADAGVLPPTRDAGGHLHSATVCSPCISSFPVPGFAQCLVGINPCRRVNESLCSNHSVIINRESSCTVSRQDRGTGLQRTGHRCGYQSGRARRWQDGDLSPVRAEGRIAGLLFTLREAGEER